METAQPLRKPIAFRLWLGLCLLLCLCGVSAAELDRTDHVTRVEVFFDASAQMGIEHVTQARFQIDEKVHRKGYFEGSTWLRVRVSPAADGGPLFLRIRPHNRNHLTLYAPDAASLGAWQSEETGNRVPWQDRPTFGQDLGFNIQPQQETTYYLRIDTAGSGSLHVSAHVKAEAARQDVINDLWRMAYLCVILSTVAWGVHAYVLNYDRLALAFSLSHLMYIGLALLSMGYIDALFPASSVAADVLFWMVLLTTTSAFAFHVMMLWPYGVSTVLRVAFVGLFLLNLVSIGMKFSGDLTPALRLNSFAILLMVPVLFITVCCSREGGVPDKRTRVLYYGLLLLSGLLHLLPVLGLFDLPRWVSELSWAGFNPVLLYGHLYYGFISALLFGHLLHARSKRLLKESQAATLALGLVEREMAWQKVRLQEKEQFTAMLTHELKNPLASIRLTLDALDDGGRPELAARHQRIGRAIRDIDALAERCVLVDSIEQGRVQLTEVDLDPEQLIKDVLAKFPLASQVHLSLAPELPMMDTDEHLLEIALSNLVENALKYALDPDSVQVSVSTSNGEDVVFEVSNLLAQGPRPDLGLIFEKYQRGKHTNGHRGTGLGLFVVRWIAQRLGGSVTGYFVSQNRIAFRLCLPLTPPLA